MLHHCFHSLSVFTSDFECHLMSPNAVCCSVALTTHSQIDLGHSHALVFLGLYPISHFSLLSQNQSYLLLSEIAIYIPQSSALVSSRCYKFFKYLLSEHILWVVLDVQMLTRRTYSYSCFCSLFHSFAKYLYSCGFTNQRTELCFHLLHSHNQHTYFIH